MKLFFQIQRLQLLIFCMDNQEFVTNLAYVFFYVFFTTFNQFLYYFIILLHIISSFSLTRSLIVPYAYVSNKSLIVFFYHHLDLSNLVNFFSKNTVKLQKQFPRCEHLLRKTHLENCFWSS